jgi:hypothetical protein
MPFPKESPVVAGWMILRRGCWGVRIRMIELPEFPIFDAWFSAVAFFFFILLYK